MPIHSQTPGIASLSAEEMAIGPGAAGGAQPAFVCRSCGDGTGIVRNETLSASWPVLEIVPTAEDGLHARLGEMTTEPYYKYEPEFACESCGETSTDLEDLLVEASAYDEEA